MSKRVVISKDGQLTDIGKQLYAGDVILGLSPRNLRACLEEFAGLVVGSDSEKEVAKICRSDKKLKEFYLWYWENKINRLTNIACKIEGCKHYAADAKTKLCFNHAITEPDDDSFATE